jgi:hypothetical protein
MNKRINVITQGRHSLRAQLKAGYLANAERDLEIATAWFPLDEEAWEKFDKALKPKKKAASSKRA